MALTFNGNTPENIVFNGNEVQTVTFNGVTVWVRVEPTCPSDEIWYWTSDGAAITNVPILWGDAIRISNTYGTKGIIKCDRDITVIPLQAFENQEYIEKIAVSPNINTLGYEAFLNCSNLTSIDLSGCSLSNTSVLSSMFGGCNNLQSITLNDMNISGSCAFMFQNCSALTEINLNNCDFTNATNFQQALNHCSSLTSFPNFGPLPIATNMRYAFGYLDNVTSINMTGLNSVDDLREAFRYDINLKELTLVGLSNITNGRMGDMCIGCTSLEVVKLGGCSSVTSIALSMVGIPDTFSGEYEIGGISSVTDLYSALISSVLTKIHLGGLANVTNMDSTFRACHAVTSISIDNQAYNVSNAHVICYDCWNLTSFSFGNANMSNLTTLQSAWYNCSKITSITINGNLSKCTNWTSAFSNCTSLETLTLSTLPAVNLTNWGINTCTRLNHTSLMNIVNALPAGGSTISYVKYNTDSNHIPSYTALSGTKFIIQNMSYTGKMLAATTSSSNLTALDYSSTPSNYALWYFDSYGRIRNVGKPTLFLGYRNAGVGLVNSSSVQKFEWSNRTDGYRMPAVFTSNYYLLYYNGSVVSSINSGTTWPAIQNQRCWNCMTQVSGVSAVGTCTLGTTNLNKLSASEKKIAVDKGWTLN